MREPASARAERFKERAAEALRAKGLRVTSPRLLVVQVLAESEAALTPHQIHDKVIEAGGQIDVVSVYRILHAIQPLGLVHYIAALDGYLACSLEEGHGPHSKHVVCSNCARVIEVPIDSESVGDALNGAEGMGFEGARVQMEIVSDSCSSCEGRPPKGRS